MKRFLVWFARQWLRPSTSLLWMTTVIFWGLSLPSIGLWAVLWLVVSAFVVNLIEVLWNDVYDKERG